jgi:hypothetical protein
MATGRCSLTLRLAGIIDGPELGDLGGESESCSREAATPAVGPRRRVAKPGSVPIVDSWGLNALAATL